MEIIEPSCTSGSNIERTALHLHNLGAFEHLRCSVESMASAIGVKRLWTYIAPPVLSRMLHSGFLEGKILQCLLFEGNIEWGTKEVDQTIFSKLQEVTKTSLIGIWNGICIPSEHKCKRDSTMVVMMVQASQNTLLRARPGIKLGHHLCHIFQ